MSEPIIIKPEDKFTVVLTGQDLQVIQAALGEIKFSLANPVMKSIEDQVLKQLENG